MSAYLDSVGVFADAVVALDDGSTDGTLAMLREEPLVKVVLRNDPRPTFAGWNDGANRRRLLAAALDLRPAWVVFLDADERLDPEDGRALTDALEGDALPGCAFGFQHHRMWGSSAVDVRFRWIYRMFAGDPSYRLPDIRFHFNPVPMQIPTTAWIATTIRVKHFGVDSPDAVSRRLGKYQEVDPAGDYGDGGDTLSSIPRRTVEWTPRAPGTPFLFDQSGSSFDVDLAVAR